MSTATTTGTTITDKEKPAEERFAFLSDPVWRSGVIENAFGKSFWGFFTVALVLGLATWAIKGADIVAEALREDIGLLLDLLPRVFVALSIAALIWVMMPREKMSQLVGKDSGMKGLAIAALAGTVTPGGPSSAYSLLAVLAISGADRGALVTYITAWATLGLQRILVWDIPFMGPEFATFRFLISLPLPIVAGLIARSLPFSLTVKNPDVPERKQA